MSRVSPEYVNALSEKFGCLWVLDDLIRLRAADQEQLPILAYPKFEHDPVNYEHFTGQDLDRFIDHAAKLLLTRGFKANDNAPVALLASSNLDFVVTFFALSRLGYTVLCISLRIPPVAIVNLLNLTEGATIIHGPDAQILTKIAEVQEQKPITASIIPPRSQFDKPSHEPRFCRDFDPATENLKRSLILHSSGSTGLPKPVFLTHRAILTHPPQGSGLKSFNALPWYHMYGLSTSFQAMWWRKTAYMYNTALPLTNKYLTTVLQTVKPQAVHAVPYVLKLLAESQEGIDELKACQLVTGAGARLPDELGDQLTDHGIDVGVVFGSTEAGLLGDSMRREPGDTTWAYLRIYPNLRPHICMKPLGDDQYELVYLKEHPALSVTNSDDPPGSFHSRDVFQAHPTIPDIWKYDTRIDDRVTLLNGEKVLPLPIEGRIRQDALVREAAVVGIDKEIPGLLLFRTKEADHLDDKQYLDAVWPAIADANSRAEGFSQIMREMVAVLPSNVEYAQTDKGNIIRAKVYLAFKDTVEKLYSSLKDGQEGTLELALPDMRMWLLKALRDNTGVKIENAESDFFSAGMDSLQATQGRRIIQKNFKLNRHKLGSNIIFDSGNVEHLATYLHGLQTGEKVELEDELSMMSRWIEKYSDIKPLSEEDINGSAKGISNETVEHLIISHTNGITNGHTSGTTNGTTDGRTTTSDAPSGEVIILTGATGSIGVHVLTALLALSTTSHVYCLVRGPFALSRITTSLSQRSLSPPNPHLQKLTALTADPALPHFGLSAGTFITLLRTVTTIVHVAWPVNFNIPLQTFEPHIVGLHNMLRFSVSTQASAPAKLLFCSSVSTAHAVPLPALIAEVPVADLAHASPMGYARSKLVGEHIVAKAVREHGATALSLRIGQVVGDGAHGIWNEGEAVPLLIRSALTVGALPENREKPTWVPVDVLADVFVDVLEGWKWETREAKVLNLVNPREFAWGDLLEKLRGEGMVFETVGMGEWLKRMEESEKRGEEDVNPGVKLLDYYKSLDGVRMETLIYRTEEACGVSQSLRNTPRVAEGEYIGNFLRVWRKKWAKG